MERCATCTHWKPSEQWETGHSLGLGRCEAVPMFWDVTEWDEDGDGRRFSADTSATAFAQDGSDYSARLYTKPEHCCTMYRPMTPSRSDEPKKTEFAFLFTYSQVTKERNMSYLPELPPPSKNFGASEYTADQMRAFARQAVAAESEQFRRLVLDDALAMTFQTMGQYRSALAKAMGAEIEKEEAK